MGNMTIKNDIDFDPHDDLPDDDDYEDERKCEGCGRNDGQCPMCCGSGMYASGSEECDFCEHSDECSEHAASL